MKKIDIDGQKLAYFEAGSGTPVLLLHCSSGNHHMWRSLIELLGPHCHLIAPDFSGYGQSVQYAATKAIDNLPDTQLIHALLEQFDRPAHVIGHSYGAALALEATREDPKLTRSLTLIEPVAFHLLKNHANKDLWLEAQRFTQGIIQYVQQGKFTAATRHYMQYWVGRLAWLQLNKKNKQAMVSSVHKVAAECQHMLRCPSTLADISSLATPTTLVRGSKTRRTIFGIHDTLMKTLPNSREIVIRGAGHLSPMTHGDMVNDIICASLMP